MAKRDYYDILGIDRGADTDVIKKAYRKLALKYHPDRNPGDHAAEESFKEATEAYEVLRHEEKRSRYDQFGHAGMDPSIGAGFGGGGGGFDMSDALRAFMRDFGGLGDIFGESAGTGSGGPARGSDLQIKLALTLEEVATGVEKKIRVKVLGPCDTCNGSGAAPGSTTDSCRTCGGQGRVRQMQRSLLGQFVHVTECPTCHGEGTLIANPCKQCRGDGRSERSEEIKVRIPAGVASGNYIPLREKGNVGPRGGPRGDLIVMIEERPHDYLERHGDDVLYDLEIPYHTAVMGGSEEIPTLDKRVRLTIPGGTVAGKIFRLSNKGIPHVRGRGKGDFLVRVIIWVPKKLKRDQKKLIESMRDSGLFEPPAR